MTVLVLISAILLLVLVGYSFIQLAPQVGSNPADDRLSRIEASPNYRNGKFQNLVETTMDIPGSKMLSVMWRFLRGGEDTEPAETLKTVPFDAKRFASLRPEEVAVCWFGHSSLLIRMHGKTFLTDPVLVGERASMFSFIGPKRFDYDHHIRVDELPPIDAVILSHDHYDHLDYQTMLQLKDKVSRFYVPLGVGAHLIKWGIPHKTITELDWWNAITFDENITLICTPARHFSGRALTNRNTTLWASWVLKGKEKRVYYGADSGYYHGFGQIGEKYGPFDLALLECGAYNEDWANIHMMPEETAQAAVDVKANVMMPIHWGKFNLALHAWRDPIRRVTKKGQALGLTLTTPRIGEMVVLNQPLPQGRWWEEYR
ncbi:MBL fold metallo-hydrolase [Nibrella viscosa]|uniref:MBL fold metallo-hydrolase n=1 Tax=Nibrella viscosa TaxID=1084524 RepID=A0ABP8KL87_9BACT